MLTSLIVVAAHDGAFTEAAHVVFPATSWAEANGTYVNRHGHKQLSEKAIEPLGSSKPAWEHAAAIGKTLGVEPTWSKLKDIRAALGPPSAPTTPASPSME